MVPNSSCKNISKIEVCHLQRNIFINYRFREPILCNFSVLTRSLREWGLWSGNILSFKDFNGKQMSFNRIFKYKGRYCGENSFIFCPVN